LLVVPQNITNNNATIAGTIAAAAANAQTLEADPTNSGALAALNTNLGTLKQQINLMNLFVQNTVTSIQTFNNSVPALAATLQQIATESSQDASADQAQINALNTQVAQLQADIKSLTASLIGLGIAAGVALTLGVVATIALWPVGAATWFVMGPIVAVSAYEITMDAIQLTSDQKQITQL
jgi:multidrug resistance efflux pump